MIAALNKKYANRVLHDVGLCICVFDLAEAGEGKVRYGDGCLWHKGDSPTCKAVASSQEVPVVFRMVVFRPFPSEVILAKVKSSSEDGIRRKPADFAAELPTIWNSLVTLGFFDDLHIPLPYLPIPSALYGTLF